MSFKLLPSRVYTKNICEWIFIQYNCFISGESDASLSPETTTEENSTQILTSSQGETIQAFVQDSLDAHEEFLEKQSTQGPNENQPTSEHLEGEQPGQMQPREQFDEDARDQSQVKHAVREEKEMENPESPPQGQGSTVGHTLETEKDDKQEENQPCGNQFMGNEAERDQRKNKQSPRPEAHDNVPVHGPGPQMTELEDAEQLETIYLPPIRPLRIDDLPDLEDVDTEDFKAVLSCKQALNPKIEVISGWSTEEERAGIQSDSVFTFNPDKSSLFLMSACNKSPSVPDTSTSLVYPEDEDALADQPNSKTNQTSSPRRCLIEELE